MPHQTLILGGTGFIGHHIARELIAHGRRVRVLARPDGDRSLLDGYDVEIVDGNLDDPSSLLAALDGCDSLIHAAAHYPLWSMNPDREAEIGRRQVLNVHEALSRHPVEKLIYVSGPAAVGRYLDGRPEDEDSPWPERRRNSAYARVKREMQELVLYNARRYNSMVVAPTGVFGPGDRKPTTGRVILDVARGRVPVGLQGRMNAVSVFAVAEGVRLALERGKVGRLYVLGGENTTIPEFLKRVAAMVGVSPPRAFLPPELVRPVALLAERLAYSSGKPAPLLPVVGVDFALFGEHLNSDVAVRELGYDPEKYPLDNALRQAWGWLQNKRMA